LLPLCDHEVILRRVERRSFVKRALPRIPRLRSSLGQPCKRTNRSASVLLVGASHEVLIEISRDRGIGSTELDQRREQIRIVIVNELCLEPAANRNIQLDISKNLVVRGAHILVL